MKGEILSQTHLRSKLQKYMSRKLKQARKPRSYASLKLCPLHFHVYLKSGIAPLPPQKKKIALHKYELIRGHKQMASCGQMYALQVFSFVLLCCKPESEE